MNQQQRFPPLNTSSPIADLADSPLGQTAQSWYLSLTQTLVFPGPLPIADAWQAPSRSLTRVLPVNRS